MKTLKPVILSHHQSRGSLLTESAILIVIYAVVAVVVLILFQFASLFAWAFASLWAIGILAFGHSWWVVWKQPHGFWCVLWTDRIACQCPDKTMGSTFDLMLDQIAEIREEEFIDSRKLVIRTRDNQEFWLTKNFGNPDMEFAREMQELCPKIHWERAR